MCRKHFEIEVEGDQKAVSKVMQAFKGMSDLRTVALRQRRIEMHLQDDAVAAAVMAHVLNTLTENKVTLVSIRSVGQQTEQAFLDLVEKEESRGFARIYHPASEAA